MRGLVCRGRTRRPVQPGGDGPGGRGHQLAVEDEELLERDGGLDAAAAGDVRVGEVEEAEHPGDRSCRLTAA